MVRGKGTREEAQRGRGKAAPWCFRIQRMPTETALKFTTTEKKPRGSRGRHATRSVVGDGRPALPGSPGACWGDLGRTRGSARRRGGLCSWSSTAWKGCNSQTCSLALAERKWKPGAARGAHGRAAGVTGQGPRPTPGRRLRPEGSELSRLGRTRHGGSGRR